MSSYTNLIFFVEYVLPPTILILGLIGNTLGLIVLSHKDLKDIGPQDMYKYLLTTDTLYLLEIIVVNLQFDYNLNLATISNLSCKLWNYVYYTYATISCWLIVYISVERCVTLMRPSWRFTLRNRRNQLLWYIFVIGFCMIYYIPVGVYFEGTISSSNNQTSNLLCGFANDFSVNLISYMDLVLRVILPFVFMIISNLTLTFSLFKSRQRIVSNFLAEENQTFYKEIKLSISSISLNIIYIVTQLPVSITVFGSQFYSNFYYEWSAYLFFVSYGINAYIIFATNSLFRSKLANILKN